MEFRVLGPFEVLDGGRALALGGTRRRALLALLLLRANEVVSMDRLLDELWGEAAPPTATKIVQNEAVRLRKILGDRLETRAPGYLLRVEPGELDRDRFEHCVARARELPAAQAAEMLREGLSMWRGSPLADLAYEAFAQPEIARLEEVRLGALEERIDADLSLGRHNQLLGELKALTSEQPLRERIASQLMLALYRSGRQAEALDVYQHARATLVTELGLEPGEALRALQDRVLCQDPALRAPTVQPQQPDKPAEHAKPDAGWWWRPLVGAVGLLAVAVLAGVLVLAHGGAASQRVAANSVGVIDPRTDRVVASVPVGTRPGTLSFGEGAIWVANLDDDSVSRIDPHTRSVIRSIATGEAPAGLAAGDGGVWVASPNGALRRIDPAFDVVHELATGSRGYLTSVDLPSPAVVGGGAVWVVNKTTVSRIDGRTGKTLASIGLGLSPAGLAIGDGAVWVADSTQDTVTRIDTSTDTATTTPVGHGASAVAVGAGAVWVADSSDDAVVRIDPETNAVTNTIAVGRSPTGIAVGAGSVWVANSDSGTISRIDPATDTVTATITVGNSPNSIVFADGELWVSVQANALGVPVNPAAGAGNIARFDIQTDSDLLSLDPAIANAPDPSQIEYATCAKLLNYPDNPAPAGLQPVPEVASAMPTVSNDGLTYKFQIRGGFRFSPPSDAPVTAQTFVSTIDRTLNPRMHSPADSFMGDIVGAPTYMQGRAASIAGVSARGATLTIRLAQPDPILPVKLATPYFCAVPTGTPINPDGVPGIPSAGPYYVSSYVPGQVVVVRRNPNYTRPRPQRIPEFEYTIGIDPARSVQRIEAGQADYLVSTDVGALPYAADLPLLARYGPNSTAAKDGHQQYFINPTPGPLLAIWLNTSRPLFAHVNLRKALDYAIDRSALIREVEHGGGPLLLPFDHYIPPGIPGFENIHSYPLDHPDLASARRLAGPGYHGTAVLYSGVFDPQSDQIIARALTAIGIDTIIKRFPINVLLAKERTHDEPFDLVSGGSALDYPDPYDILNTSLDGNLIAAHDNPDWSNFNEPAYNRKLEAAARLSGAARYNAYAKLDADLTANAAPIVAWATSTSRDLFSARIGCQTYQPVYGIDIAALCIRR